MTCPNCGSEEYVKNGKVRGKQRYKCKDCLYNYTTFERGFVPLKTRQTIIKDYFRQKKMNKAAEKAKISRVTLYAWLRQLIKNISEVEDVKKELKLSMAESGRLDYLDSDIKKRGWTHPLSKKQLIELSLRHIDILIILLKHRPRK